MSLARAFTTRRSKPSQSADGFLQRSMTTKVAFPTGTIRHKISAPIELVSTTNMLSYNAPDIYPSANSSGDESDSVPSLSHSPGGSTHDIASIDSAPTSPEPNHLSCYFEKKDTARNSNSSSEGVPAIPKRALSHTKRTHEALHRQRSISRVSGQISHTSKPSVTSVVRDSIQMFSSTPEIPSEPFGKELAQVNELAEEFGSLLPTVHIVTEEERVLFSRGFLKFAAQDYLYEIEPLYQHAFGNNTSASMWI